MRFEMWHRCDVEHGHKKERHLRTVFQKPSDRAEEDTYPCFEMYYETVNACNDDWFQFLSELHYYRVAQGVREKDFWNREIRTPPTTYDVASLGDNRNYTY